MTTAAALNPSTVLIIIYAVIALYLFATKKTAALKHLAVATLIALVWMLAAQSQYGYNVAMLDLFGINLFPLFAWALGLFTCYLIYSRLRRLLPTGAWWLQLIAFTFLYVPLLLLAETIAYHQFGLMNLATASYAGLPLCDCLHAPAWMQAAYLLMGSAYFAVCLALHLEPSGKALKPSEISSDAATTQ